MSKVKFIILLFLIYICTFSSANAAVLFDGDASQLRANIEKMAGSRIRVSEVEYSKDWSYWPSNSPSDVKAYHCVVGNLDTIESCHLLLMENSDKKIVGVLAMADMSNEVQTANMVSVAIALTMFSLGMTNEEKDILVDKIIKEWRKAKKDGIVLVSSKVKCKSIGKLIIMRVSTTGDGRIYWNGLLAE